MRGVRRLGTCRGTHTSGPTGQLGLIHVGFTRVFGCYEFSHLDLGLKMVGCAPLVRHAYTDHRCLEFVLLGIV